MTLLLYPILQALEEGVRKIYVVDKREEEKEGKNKYRVN